MNTNYKSNLIAGLLTAGLFLASAAWTFAAQGELDPTFSGDGKLTDWAGAASAVVLQPNGKIVVVGTDADNSRFAVARYNPDGSSETAFGGGDGKVTTDIGFSHEGANAVALQSVGKIVLSAATGMVAGANGATSHWSVTIWT